MSKIQLLWDVTKHKLGLFANFYDNIIKEITHGDKEETSDALSYDDDPYGEYISADEDKKKSPPPR